MILLKLTTQYRPRDSDSTKPHISYYLLDGDFLSPAATSLQSLFSLPFHTELYSDSLTAVKLRNLITSSHPSVEVLLDLPEITRPIAIQHFPEYFL